MMKLKRIFMIILMLPAFSCEQLENSEIPQEEGTPVLFPLDTKAPSDGDRTYRVVMTNMGGDLKGQGSYCSKIFVAGFGPEENTPYTWYSPCRVDNNGTPLNGEGNPVTDLDDADHSSKNGLFWYTYSRQGTILSVVSPAIRINLDANQKAYFEWDSVKQLFLSDNQAVSFEGSWINDAEKSYYVFDNADMLKLTERRAKFSVSIECGEQPEADIQSVMFNYVKKARWYIPGDISTTENHYQKSDVALHDWPADTEFKHITKNGESWSSGDTYILPLDYSKQEYLGMVPKLVVKLGTNRIKPIVAEVELSELFEPMHNYKLTIKVSSTTVYFKLQAEPWYDGGTSSTADEGWATIAVGSAETWEPGGTIGTDDWNTSI